MPQDPLTPIAGITLARYAAIRRALVRLPSASRLDAEGLLARHGMSLGDWARVEDAWSQRIRESQAVRAAFRELYARPIADDPIGN